MSQIVNVLLSAFGQWIGFFVFLFIILLIQRRYLLQLNRLGGRKAMLIPAVLFVPIHELSHAFVALVMGHKVKSIVFFQMNDTNTLGYVEHAYKKTVLSPFTNMFIGMAPLIGGGVACYWITYWLMPSLLSVSYISQATEWITLTDIINAAKAVGNIMLLHWGTGLFWLWLFLIVNAATFSVPSSADFNGASGGIIITLGLYLCLSYYVAGSTSQIDSNIARGVLAIMPFLIIIALSGAVMIGVLALTNRLLSRAN